MKENPLVSVVIPTYNRARSMANSLDRVVKRAGFYANLLLIS